jgi:hypothetical protein
MTNFCERSDKSSSSIKVGDFLTSLIIIKFLRKALYHGIS